MREYSCLALEPKTRHVKKLEQKTDEYLMKRFARNLDEQAFRELTDRYRHSALAFTRRRIFDQSAVDDIVQEAFIRVVRHRERYDADASFSAWFYTILRNACIDYMRRQQRYQNKLARLTELAMEPEEQRPRPDLKNLLCHVDRDMRDLLVRHYIHGMTYQELAHEQGCSLEKIKKQAQRAVKKIRENLSRSSDDERTLNENHF